jgi:hypothetical protein
LLAPMTVLGRSQPSRLSTRTNALVPERCIPSTRMQTRRGPAGGFVLADFLLNTTPSASTSGSRHGAPGPWHCAWRCVTPQPIVSGQTNRLFFRRIQQTSSATIPTRSPSNAPQVSPCCGPAPARAKQVATTESSWCRHPHSPIV